MLQLGNDDAAVRDAAQRSLYALDREAWRRRLPELVGGADLASALTALELATQDAAQEAGNPASEEIAEAVAARWSGRSWYPQLAAAFIDDWRVDQAWRAELAWLRAARAAELQGLPRPPRPETRRSTLAELQAELRELSHRSNDAVFAAPLAEMCPEDPAPARHSAQTAWHDSTILAAAVAATGVDGREAAAALHTEDGWYVGHDGGEFGGLVTLHAPSVRRRLLARTGTEPRVIFNYDGSIFFVAGGQHGLAEVQRVLPARAGFAVRSVLHLPAPPDDVVIVDGRLLMHLERNGWIDLSTLAPPRDMRPVATVRPRWLGCSPEPPGPETSS